MDSPKREDNKKSIMKNTGEKRCISRYLFIVSFEIYFNILTINGGFLYYGSNRVDMVLRIQRIGQPETEKHISGMGTVGIYTAVNLGNDFFR